jgi:cytochrome c-type biogenesis protein CcmH
MTVSYPANSEARPSKRLLITVASFLAVVTAAGMVLLNGHRASAEAVQVAAASPKPTAPAAAASAPAEAASGTVQPDPQKMVAQLEEKLKSKPDDIEGWTLLGRAYTALGRHEDSVKVYRRMVVLQPKDAQVHADLGRAIGNANGRKLNEEAEAMLNKALKIDKNNVMANALLGKVSMDRNQPERARTFFETALSNIHEEHPFAEQLRHAIRVIDASKAQPQQAPAAAASSSTPTRK